MTLWICNACGSAERLNMHPDCCSMCGGTLETQEGRDTTPYGAGLISTLVTCEEDFNDPYRIMCKWHLGASLTRAEQSVIDALLYENRVGLLGHVYAEIREAA